MRKEEIKYFCDICKKETDVYADKRKNVSCDR